MIDKRIINDVIVTANYRRRSHLIDMSSDQYLITDYYRKTLMNGLVGLYSAVTLRHGLLRTLGLFLMSSISRDETISSDACFFLEDKRGWMYFTCINYSKIVFVGLYKM